MNIAATNMTKLKFRPPFSIRVATRSNMQFPRLRLVQLTLVSSMNLVLKRAMLAQCATVSTFKVDLL